MSRPKVLLVTSAGTNATGGGQSFTLSTKFHENALDLSECFYHKITLPIGPTVIRKFHTFTNLIRGHLGGVSDVSIELFSRVLDQTQPTAVFFDWTLFGPLAKIAKNAGCFVFTQSHNCEYDFYAGEAALRGGLTGELLRAAYRAESQAIESSDVVLTLSSYDRNRMRQIYGGPAECIVVNPHLQSLVTRLQSLNSKERRNGPLSAVFLGSASQQNHLASSLLIKGWSGETAKLNVIGTVGDFIHKEHDKSTLSARRINVSGFVESLDSIFAESDAMVCPMHLGSGIKVKIIDALANCCPVFASPEAIHGFEFAQKSGWVRECAVNEMEQAVAGSRSLDLSLQQLIDDTTREAASQAQTLRATYARFGLSQ